MLNYSCKSLSTQDGTHWASVCCDYSIPQLYTAQDGAICVMSTDNVIMREFPRLDSSNPTYY